MQVLLADQLGPHFQVSNEVVLPEVLSQFSKRVYHRKKAHVILSALRHRALDPGVELVKLETYRDWKYSAELVHPSSREFLSWAKAKSLSISTAKGFICSVEDFETWRESRKSKKLVLEDFYRWQRIQTGLLMQDGEPIGGQWNFDAENRLPPPKSGITFPEPFVPAEDEIDEKVRWDLSQLEAKGLARFSGKDGPRLFPVTRSEAILALQHFVEYRLATFGPYEDAVSESSWTMSHSMLSVPMNLGLLDPIEVAAVAHDAYLAGLVPIASAEGFIRQVIGWREYVWQLYWNFGADYTSKNELEAIKQLPDSWKELNSEKTEARCLSKTLDTVAAQAWTHHIPRLMILGNIALQQGYLPSEVNDWFIDNFADGYKWVMPANVIGMSLYADGGMMSTKPYAAGGSYISKMTNHCGSCKFDPKQRTGEKACPLTNGYWKLLDKHEARFSSNHRMFQAMAGLRKLKDRDQLGEIDFEKYGF